MRKSFPTTLDNPYNYFTQFDEWNAFDIQKGYNTCAYLARVVEMIVGLPKNPSEAETTEAINKATDEIVRVNVNGLYTKQTIE